MDEAEGVGQHIDKEQLQRAACRLALTDSRAEDLGGGAMRGNTGGREGEADDMGEKWCQNRAMPMPLAAGHFACAQT